MQWNASALQVADEEACGFRAMNLLYGPMACRGAPIPEYAHPAWNDTLRALASSKLNGAVMQGTLLCNYYQGPFHSGTHGCHLQEAARKLADSCSDDFLAELGVGHIEDMGLPDHYVMTREDILECPGVATKLPQDLGRKVFVS